MCEKVAACGKARINTKKGDARRSMVLKRDCALWALLSPAKTTDSKLYFQQVQTIRHWKSRPELVNKGSIVCHHENARPDTSLAIL